MSFANIKNQKQIVQSMKTLLKKSRMPHALLFLGSSAAGQLEVSKEMAKALFCADVKDGDSCDACPACKRVDENTHPDFLVTGVEESSVFIKVEAIREIISRCNFKPFEAPYKVFVIEEAELMNETSQSALLKTLEEPPGNTLFILITSAPDKLLATIHSRCQTFYFAPSQDTRIFSEKSRDSAKQVIDYILYDLPAKKTSFYAPDLGKLDRDELKETLDFIMEFYRDVLLLRVGAKEMVRSNENLLEKERVCKKMSESEIMERIDFVSGVKEKVSEMANLRIALAVFWEGFESENFLISESVA